MIEYLLQPDVTQKAINRLLGETKNEIRLLGRNDADAKYRANKSGASAGDLNKLKDTLEAYSIPEALTGIEGPVWMPRDALSSLVHSIYDEFFDELDLIRESESRTSLTRGPIAVSALELEPEAINFLEPNKRLGGRWLTRFGERDWRFLSWGAAAKIEAFTRGRHDFPDKAATPFQIGERDRVLLVGDWGSGIPRALQVSKAMRTSLDDALRDQRNCHVIHLGDVYYTGQKREYDKRFLKDWPVKTTDDENRISSWCLNANHDMFSGGHDYFNHVLADPRFRRQKKSSYFSLENKHWQILGLDSAYDDGDLHGEQAGWVHQRLTSAPQKAGILLSHHQPFSDYEKGSDNMLQRLKPVLRGGLVRAWFWGHEHRCAIYEPRENIEYPRLIGHGGVPVWAPSTAKPPNVAFQYGMADNQYFYHYNNEKFLRFGFAELTFDEKKIIVEYKTELGVSVKSEELVKP